MPRELRPVDVAEMWSTRFLPGHVFHLARDLRTAVERELSRYDITSQQAALILMVALHRGAPAARIAEHVGTDTAGMTRLIDRLETKGYVARRLSSEDRRIVTIELTEAGQVLVPMLRAAFARVNQRLLEGLDANERGQLHALLRRLDENVAAMASGASGPAGC
jgi:DNA-binding MarR family transcriptional regulator